MKEEKIAAEGGKKKTWGIGLQSNLVSVNPTTTVMEDALAWSWFAVNSLGFRLFGFQMKETVM